jgi:hypothetical protein
MRPKKFRFQSWFPHHFDAKVFGIEAWEILLILGFTPLISRVIMQS